jgi:hypothetical protein
LGSFFLSLKNCEKTKTTANANTQTIAKMFSVYFDR